MTEEQIVKTEYPECVLFKEEEILAYHKFTIKMYPNMPFRIGGGNTPEDAWHNAWVHLSNRKRQCKIPDAT